MDMREWTPFDPLVLEDPATGHRGLLEQCPVHHCSAFDPPFYTLSRFDDVERALRDVETFSSHWGQGPRFTDPHGLLSDPPRHTRLRTIVQTAFTPRRVETLRAPVQELCDQLLDTALDRPGGFDAHDDFAFPLPVIIIARMLGIPETDLERFKYWSDLQVTAMGAEDPTPWASELRAMTTYLTRHLSGRRAAIDAGEPVPDDLLSVIADAREEDGSRLPESEALSILQQLLVGGNETTTSLITNLIWRLLQHPEQWRKLCDHPDRIEGAIEESLRFDPPVLGLYRTTTREVTLHDVTIPAGHKVLVQYAAANRDPRVFANPDAFDIDRPRQRHMSFGLGVHFCIGAPMARLEAVIAMRTLVRRAPDLALADSGERIAPFFLWGRSKLPVRRTGSATASMD